MGKKAAAHIGCVIKGILFIGFSIQIVLGIIWMCSNFAHVQDFGEPESAFYGTLFRICGRCPQVMYVLQLVVAFVTDYLFVQAIRPGKKCFAVWGALVLVTFPFAMQTALAVQPYSFMGSLFLLLLYFAVRRTARRKVWVSAMGVCLVLFVWMSGVVDADREEYVWGYSWEASMASRIGGPTLWYDMELWSEELREITADVLWTSTYFSDNMVLLIDVIEGETSPEEARKYYGEIIKVGWDYHWPMIIRQVGWDVLGYTVTPLIVPLQLEGEAYDSYTGGNYEAMRGNTPVLTRCYVEYGCWWFGWSLCMTMFLFFLWLLFSWSAENKKVVGRSVLSVVICLVAAGVLVAALTLRGAGLMDYRWTVGVNQLWLLLVLWLMRREGNVN